ncbi:deaminase [Allosaccharopolyspora coralli]|uniref:Deaminase n=1 Tax=Allosaccharopolyspora coralli TaxID=2665642 RepID=A0A5Q3QB65_9PSEU|nr:dihydrofolate reductase family protein [Allosaccharopolyspora coralli]QGK70454.1 deaminase [Allosaccharopolyspora coralli]
MSPRPYVLLSVATALDGYIDDSSSRRLLLSNGEDLERVDAVRASVDAIAVGANTIRTDNPRLLVQSDSRRRQRLDAGLGATPTKVTFSVTGDLDPAAHFFTTGDADKLVYTPTGRRARLIDTLGEVATVVDAGEPFSLTTVLADLAAREVRRVMVEGGGVMHTLFLGADVVDELHLVYAPFFVGDTSAPRFVRPTPLPQNSARRMTLAETRQIGDVVLLRYLPLGGENPSPP